jgi:hypothetical protein
MKIRTLVFLASLLLTTMCHADVLVEFSPEGSAQQLVMNTLNSAHHSINLLVNAGIGVRTVDNYKIMHDKVAIIDGVTTQTGSFNYTRAA